jgi:hypothetical protein
MILTIFVLCMHCGCVYLPFQTRPREVSGGMRGSVGGLQVGEQYPVESGVVVTDSGQLGASERLSTGSSRVSAYVF